MKNRLATTMLCITMSMVVAAQTAREEIHSNKYLVGGNYLDYERQRSDQQLTPAPSDYKPFYMSHYGRHGSRWLISKDSYTSVTEPLQKARNYGKLTDKGQEVLGRLEHFVSLPKANFPEQDGSHAGAQLRLGDLTTVGERQHHGIGRRMAENFPEIFKHDGVTIDARSTTVNRCILSMIAECEELMAANPTARIHNEVSDALQYYMNAPRTGLVKAGGRKGREIRRQLGRGVSANRLVMTLFNDQQWAADSIDGDKLMSNLFEVVTNMQSHDEGCDLYELFTEEEIYQMWRIRNIGWYVDYGHAPQTGGVMAFSQKNLLRNIIETADTVVHTQATLRFGHEVCVLPLACLLELDSCGASISNLDKLDDVWRNYRIFPMACNIQLIFYRRDQGNGDVLVKALLNERECRLPVASEQHPYYRWADLRQYYLEKLSRYEQQEREAEEVRTDSQ